MRALRPPGEQRRPVTGSGVAPRELQQRHGPGRALRVGRAAPGPSAPTSHTGASEVSSNRPTTARPSTPAPLPPATPSSSSGTLQGGAWGGTGSAAAAAEAAAAAAAAAASAGSNNTRLSVQFRPFQDAWDKGFAFDAQEDTSGTWLEVVSGAVPPQLRGTYFRNGPGRFRRGPDAVRHPYDADGFVAAVGFPGDGSAAYRGAFVRTLESQAEAAAGRMLFRGAFATCRRGGMLGNALDLTVKNTSNTGVVMHRGALLTLFEAGLPYALDPASLATLGPVTLAGALRPGPPVSLGSPAANELYAKLHRRVGANGQLPPQHTAPGGDGCCAHPRRCGVTGRRVFWSTRLLGGPLRQDTRVSFWEEDDGGGEGGRGDAAADAAYWAREADVAAALEREAAAAEAGAPAAAAPSPGASSSAASSPEPAAGDGRLRARYTLRGYCMVHDVAVTANYYIVIQAPVHSQSLPYLLGEVGPVASLRWRGDEPSVVHVLPRPGSEAERRGEQPLRIPLSPATCVLHHVNAWEEALPDQPPAEQAGAQRQRPEEEEQQQQQQQQQQAAEEAHDSADPQAPVASAAAATASGDAAAQAAASPAASTAGPSPSGATPPPPPPPPRVRVVLDSVHYPSLPAVGAQPLPEQRLPDNDAGYGARLRRLVLHLHAGSASLAPSPCPWYVEQPSFNAAYTGRRHRFVYGFSVVPGDACGGVVKVDMAGHGQAQRWVPPRGYVCLEPTFVPRLPAAAAQRAGAGGGGSGAYAGPGGRMSAAAAAAAALPAAVQGRMRGEDDGWLLVQGFDSVRGRSELLVFDAWRLPQGPVAVLALPAPLPHALHGTWVDDFFAPPAAGAPGA